MRRPNPKWEAWESEVSCLGAVFLESGAYDRLSDIVRPEDFGDPAHGIIWASVGRMRAKGQPIEPAAVATMLDESGELARVGGVEYLLGLSEAVSTSINVEHHGRIVVDYAAKRRLRDRLADAQRELAGLPAEEIATFRDGIVGGLLDESADAPTVAVDIVDATLEEVRDIRRRVENPEPFVGIPTGLIDLDAIIQGFEDGDLVTLGAASGHGKTMAGLQFAVSGARLSGRHSMYFSVEVKATRLARRQIAALGRVNATRLKTADLDDSELVAMQRGVREISELRGLVSLVYAPRASVATIHREVRRYRMRPGAPRLGLVVVDYIQRLHPAERRAKREEEVSEMARSLKDLAGQYECPVMVLAQLNRDAGKRQNKRPIPSDLRESSAMEHDSSILLFLHRPAKWGEQGKDGVAEIIVAKARDGADGIAEVGCDPSQQRLFNLVRRDA